jgi:hypothetical protein
MHMKKNYSFHFITCFLLAFGFLSNQAYGQAPIMQSIDGLSSVCSPPAAQKNFTAVAINNPTQYNWSVIPSTGVVISNPSSQVTMISFPNTNLTYTIMCSAANAFGTSNVKTKIVTVYETPTVTFSGNNTFCQGSSTNLSASPTIISASSTLSYSWSPSTGLNSTTSQNVVASPPTTTTYSVLLTIGSCTNMAMITVNVIPQPCSVGIESHSKQESTLAYPNPNNGSFIVSTTEATHVTVINELGQTVTEFKLDAREEKQVTGLSKGIYFVLTGNSRHKVIVGD